jgi:hypothetical protein
MTRRAAEYLQHAKECRRLALVVADVNREPLLNMAAAWEALAQEHESPDTRPEIVRAMDET